MAKPNIEKEISFFNSKIIGESNVELKDLKPHPLNFRRHGEFQKKVLEEILSEVGMVQRIIVNKRTGYILDGHLRYELALEKGEKTLPVTYVDLSEEEEKKVLATFDATGALADID